MKRTILVEIEIEAREDCIMKRRERIVTRAASIDKQCAAFRLFLDRIVKGDEIATVQTVKEGRPIQ